MSSKTIFFVTTSRSLKYCYTVVFISRIWKVGITRNKYEFEITTSDGSEGSSLPLRFLLRDSVIFCNKKKHSISKAYIAHFPVKVNLFFLYFQVRGNKQFPSKYILSKIWARNFVLWNSGSTYYVDLWIELILLIPSSFSISRGGNTL